VAEETGLLITMDQQVLADAVRQAAAWQAHPGATDVEVAINVTSRHLADAGFAKSIIELLDANGVPRHNLQIELTEQVLMEASNSSMAGLRLLRGVGVQIGLDDFGTGYSSLAYLRNFPLDFVKIDQSFICDLDRVENERSIVAAIVTLCHALGLTVVAEGVETEGQLRLLQSLGCDRAQGFLFGRPGDASDMDELISGKPPSLGPPMGSTTGRSRTSPGPCTLDPAPAVTCDDLVVGTGVDPVTSRFSGARSAN
jgi:EAL domain-containing protein (putative c-di-GMP-specific phosphodiesterase class I)